MVGLLLFDLFRACRLVVDTGLHALAWPKEKAVAYMVNQAGMALDMADAEIDRLTIALDLRHLTLFFICINEI